MSLQEDEARLPYLDLMFGPYGVRGVLPLTHSSRQRLLAAWRTTGYSAQADRILGVLKRLARTTGARTSYAENFPENE